MCPNPQFLADVATFTEEILNGNLHFLCSEIPGEQEAFHRKKFVKIV